MLLNRLCQEPQFLDTDCNCPELDPNLEKKPGPDSTPKKNCILKNNWIRPTKLQPHFSLSIYWFMKKIPNIAKSFLMIRAIKGSLDLHRSSFSAPFVRTKTAFGPLVNRIWIRNEIFPIRIHFNRGDRWDSFLSG